MALAAVRLDDLTWSDLVSAARQRLPALSGGEWTLHAPVDPGVTLVELYAWLLEQRLYWLDQVPDALLRNIVNLLGEEVRPARAATTVVQLSSSASSCAAGTELSVVDALPQLFFTTQEDVALLPVARLGLWAGGRDRTADLAEGRVLRLMRADGAPDECKLVFWLTAPPPAAAAPLGLLLELAVPDAIAPQWSPEAAGVPAPAMLRFFYSGPAGTESELPAALVDDGTGGLRRSGVLRLPVPADWSIDPAAGADVSAAPYSISLRTDAATFTAPPRLIQATANVARAAHLRTHGEDQTLQWPPLPGRVLPLPEEARPPLPGTVSLRLLERAQGWKEWLEVADLGRHGPAERVFVVDRAAGALRFGDGLTGRQPVLLAGATNARIAWQSGGGPAGEIAAGTPLENAAAGIDAVAVVAALGGFEPETPADARRRLASGLLAVERAVTRSDHVQLAVTTPGVAMQRAFAAVGFTPRLPCAVTPGATTVLVVPDAPRGEQGDLGETAFVGAPQPDPGALQAVRARLDKARLAGSELCVCGPRYRKVALAVEVDVAARDADALRSRVAERMRKFLDPLEGGDDGQGYPFGEPLRPSELLREAAAALLGEGTASRVVIGLDGAAPSESCNDVPLEAAELPSLTGVSVRIVTGPPRRAGLR